MSYFALQFTFGPPLCSPVYFDLGTTTLQILNRYDPGHRTPFEDCIRHSICAAAAAAAGGGSAALEYRPNLQIVSRHFAVVWIILRHAVPMDRSRIHAARMILILLIHFVVPVRIHCAPALAAGCLAARIATSYCCHYCCGRRRQNERGRERGRN